jgi:FtsP/CotA-like multicopper oxidase with cupredoxin domain
MTTLPLGNSISHSPFRSGLLLIALACFALSSAPKAFGVSPAPANTSSTLSPVSPVADYCGRFTAGSVVSNPPALFSQNGTLNVRFSYQHKFDSANRELFCFMTPDGLQNPTLHVKPGDHLVVTVTNNTPAQPLTMTLDPPNCGASRMGNSSVNIHYHGTNTSPTCHQDEVIKTVINSGETFQYDVAFPTNEPPGLYWYHPHIHGIAEHALQGGAAGAIVVDGIEDVQPAVSDLRPRILMVRDQHVPGNPHPRGNIPSWDVTLNYVPITSPTDPNSNNFVPAILRMEPGERQFWRVSNSCSDTILDLQYVFDGVPQTFQVVSVDGVAVNSQDGTQPGSPIPVTHFTLPPASRVEFIVSAPPATVQLAQLITLRINTGPFGDNDPKRPLATIHLVDHDDNGNGGNKEPIPKFTKLNSNQRRFSGLGSAPVAVNRTVFFNENQATQQFFMDVEGRPEHQFDPNRAPDIVATQGTVEEWTVQNRTPENHEFHFHQLHFLVVSQNNFELNGSQPAPAITGQYLDMIQVPFWDQNPQDAFPSVTLRIDFRGSDIGIFVFHCHILNHEDLGMMNIIQVVRRSMDSGNSSASRKVTSSAKTNGSTKQSTLSPQR